MFPNSPMIKNEKKIVINWGENQIMSQKREN
jgi:hypothetical protein